MKHVDIAIVGAGVMGLAHAVHAARAGLSVAVFERSPHASGASVRNFGMLAIVAQSQGQQLDSAQRTLACWQDVSRRAGIEMAQSGCLFVAREPEEMAVLAEYASMPASAAKIIAAQDLANHALNLRPELLGGLWSPDAWKLDQRRAMHKIADWLHQEHGVGFHFSTEVKSVTPVIESDAGAFMAGHTIICAGNDFASLFPDAFRKTGVTSCQLQMLRTNVQPESWHLKPFLLGGLSLTRYSAFAGCSSMPDLIEKQQKTQADHLAHGVHVIACQEADGSITIGDSHAYGDDVGSARSEDADRLILDDLAGMISLPDPRIAERWIGQYAHLPGTDALTLPVTENVTAVTMTNGQGMTHAFAVAEDTLQGLI